MSNEPEVVLAIRDLARCDVLEAVGDAKAKRQARKHRAACHAFIRAENAREGLDAMSLEELAADLEGY